jgi:hypothetical protein
MAAQTKPKPQRTQPCANKLWKKAAKVYWRFLIASPFSEKMRGLDTSLTKIKAQMGWPFYVKDAAWDYVCPENIYGKRDKGTPVFDDPQIDMAQKDWWHPPKDWDWVWASPATEDAPAIRRRKPLDPRRLP